MGEVELKGQEDFERRTGELLMTFPVPVKSLQSHDGRLFAVLADGQTIDLTDLLGEAKH
jgi:hypothetical protein